MDGQVEAKLGTLRKHCKIPLCHCDQFDDYFHSLNRPILHNCL